MKHAVAHQLGQDRAKQVVEAAFESYEKKLAKYNPTTRWVSEQRAEIAFSVKGITLNGAVSVSDKSIDMELEVPFLLRPFKGKALDIIEREIRAWMAKAEAGEL